MPKLPINSYLKRFIKKSNNKKNLEEIELKNVKDNYLLENYFLHEKYANTINQTTYWEKMKFEPDQGYIKICNGFNTYQLALKSEDVLQAYAATKLSPEQTILVKVLKNGSIFVNFLSREYQLLMSCNSITHQYTH